MRGRRAKIRASKRQTSGSALLTVLWLSAALSAIAFTVANTVRSETERTSTAVDSLRAYYLATGAIDRALVYVQWGGKYYTPPQPVMRFQFPSGEATVELIPESSKLNINQATPKDLTNLLASLGTPEDRAAQIVAGILDWRASSAGGAYTQFDQHYLGLKQSFQARHASFEEIEELLLVQGITPEMFYGHYVRDAQGRLTPVAGLKDCTSIYGAVNGFDANTVEPALMRAIGISPDTVSAIVALRRASPIRSLDELAPFRANEPAFARLTLGPSPIATLRSTARLRLANGQFSMSNGQFSDVQRSVSALIAFIGPQNNPPFHILRWYDNAFSTR
ncbi:MAG: general secretion pathway protein GspK [Bryobacteraceae bacterium]